MAIDYAAMAAKSRGKKVTDFSALAAKSGGSVVSEKPTGSLFSRMGKYNISNPEMGMNVAGAVGDAANWLYRGFTQLPVIKQFSQAVGGTVGALGTQIGGAVGAAGEGYIQAGRLIQGKGYDVGRIVQTAKETAKSTREFGQKTGEEAAPMAVLGAYGGFIPNAVMMAGATKSSVSEIVKAGSAAYEYLKTGDRAKYEDFLTSSLQGLQMLVPAATGAVGMAREARMPEGRMMISGDVEATKQAIIEETRKAGGEEAANIAESILKPLATYQKTSAEAKADKAIETTMTKAVRPTVVGRKTARAQEEYMMNAKEGVRTIVRNKGSLNLTDENGVKVEIPENLSQFGQAIEQTKKMVFQKYDAMAKASGKKGGEVRLEPIASELDIIANNNVIKDNAPAVAAYAEAKAQALRSRETYTTAETQEAIQLYNKSLEAFYRNPTYESATRASIDAMVVNKMRQNLDSVISETEGTGYADLKRQYGNLKTIEADVSRRAIVDARKNVKGLIDFSDIASGAEAIHGILSMSPASFASAAAIKGIAAYYKYLNNPNRMVADMFRKVDAAESVIPPIMPKAWLSELEESLSLGEDSIGPTGMARARRIGLYR